jgi:hypothetical protein
MMGLAFAGKAAVVFLMVAALLAGYVGVKAPNNGRILRL